MYMAASSPRVTKSYKSRCVSLPVRSHPSVNKVQEELCKLRSFAGAGASSNSKMMICSSLYGLTELYRCIGDLFKSPDVQQSLAQTQHQNLMNELLEVSLKYLDVCSSANGSASTIKQDVLELQSALRRSKKGGDFSIESYINAYVRSRKEIKKEIAKSLALIKETEVSLESFPLFRDLNVMICALVKVLQETSLTTCFVFSSVLLFLSSPGQKTKSKGWGLVMKLVKKGTEERNDKGSDELESMEAELRKLMMTTNEDDEEIEECEKIQCALMRSEAVEAAMEELQEGLEGLFRVMIQARVALLNILSS